MNRELVLLYWQIGHDILIRQTQQGWGAKVIDRLAHDLRVAFPAMKGFSPRNLKYMRAFAEAWPDTDFVQQAAAQLPWGHNLVLLDKLPGPETRRWYAAKAIEHNWSRNILVMQIEARLLERSGKAISNFDSHLPKPQSDLARESLKDPYRFDFLGLTLDAQEREIENALVKHNWWSSFRQSCKPACPASSRSSASWQVMTHSWMTTRNDPKGDLSIAEQIVAGWSQS